MGYRARVEFALERLAKYPPPRGLWRFRTLEEANAHRAEWVTERIRRLAAERQR
jgi:hypothetical protein